MLRAFSFFILGSPAWGATPLEEGSSIFKLLNEDSDRVFAQEWKNSNEGLRQEFLGVIKAEPAAWKALKDWDRLNWEKPVKWVEEKDLEKKDFSGLKFLSLGQFPVETKVKLEKLACFRAPLKSPATFDLNIVRAEMLCGLSKFVPFLKKKSQGICQDLSQKKMLSQYSPCEAGVEVSLALDLIGEQGIFEEKLWSFSTKEFQEKFLDKSQRGVLRREVWSSLERLFTKVPRFKENLLERIRVAELADSSLTEDKFLRRRKLSLFLQNVKKTDPLSCADLEPFYLEWSLKRTPSDELACPSQPTIKLAQKKAKNYLTQEAGPNWILPKIKTFDRKPAARLYQTELRDLLQDSLIYFTRHGLLEKSPELLNEAQSVVKEGLTSDFMGELQERLGSYRRGFVDLRGEAAAILLKRMESPHWVREKEVEKHRLEKIHGLLEKLYVASRKLNPSEGFEAEIQQKIRNQYEMSESLIRELLSRS